MKSFKNIYRTLALLALIVVALPGMSQPHNRGPMGPEKHQQRMEDMREQLNLTDQQFAQIQDIHEKYRPQMEALHQNGDPDREAMREVHRAIRKEMKAVLTEEQREKMKEMRPRHGHRGMHPGHRDRAEMKAARQEVRAYMKENVMPVLQEARRQFDSEISPADQRAIADLRAELEAHRPEKKAQRQEMRATRQAGDRPSEAERTKMWAMREAHRAIMEKAEAIAGHYTPQLNAIHDGLQPQAEQWHANVKAILDKYRPADPDGNRPEGHAGRGDGPKDKMNKIDRKMEAARFLLMDPNRPVPADAPEGEMVEPVLEVFPNPTGQQNSLQYEVKSAGNVTVELITKTGDVIKRLLDEYHTPGTYTLEVDMADRRTDVYYYRVTDASGTRMKRFSVVK
ncbi:MAG: Spy/CpxP family protein refolding chaperone [Bacteroidota bacterium]